MKSSPLQFALRETQVAARSRYTRIGLLLAVALLTISGPFDTLHTFNIGQRLAYWAAMVIGCYFLGQAATSFFVESFRTAITQRWPRVVVSALCASLPVSALVLLVNGLAQGHMDASVGLTIWLDTTLVTLGVVVALVFLNDALAANRPAAATAAGAVPQMPGPPPILERVPLPQRGRLLALSVEDHYVDIITDRGKTLVLMRLADAIRETGSVPGLQTHRSHWVAQDAVVRTHRSDGKLILELSNGMRLPVSRGYLAQVREAGLG